MLGGNGGDGSSVMPTVESIGISAKIMHELPILLFLGFIIIHVTN